MEILLPHRKVELDTSLTFEERTKVINSLLNEVIDFHAQSMTVEEYFRFTWKKNSTITCMDIIGYYLSKEEKDLTILSQKKENEMAKGSKRHTTFSSMGKENQQQYGLIDLDEN